MDNAYVHGLKQHDSRPRSPVVVPCNMSALRKKILFENTLLEERALHEFSAGKGDGAGVDTGSAPLAPASAPVPAGIPVASTASVEIAGGTSDPNWHRGTYQKTSVQVTYAVDGEDRFKFTPSSTIYWFGYARGFLLVPPSCSVLCEWYHEGTAYTTTIDSTSNWRLISFSAIEDGPVIIELNTNASSNGSFIPDTSWSAPAITITAAPPGIPLNSSTITLNFPSAVHGSSRSFSSGNYSLSRLDNSQWRTSGQGPLTPGFYVGLGLTYNANWPQSYGGFPEGNNKWVVYNGYSDEGSAYMDILYYHPTANSTSIPVNGWLLGSFYGTPTTGGDLTITAA